MTNSENTGCIHYTYDMCGNLYSKAIDKFEDIQSGQTSIVTGEILGASDTTDTTIYEYDVFNRMDTMSDNGKEWTFEYNADGQRVSKSNGSQSLEYIWNGNNIVSEKNENNQSTYFQRGLSLLTMEREQDNFKHYYFKNAHGDVTGVVDTRTNTIKYSYDYDAFGNQIFNSATNTNIFSSGYNGEAQDTNPFRYAGEYFDRETGMIYLRNRYYIPDYGRFTQQDPIFDGTNWYVYCVNNPIMFVDPTGYWAADGSDERFKESDPIKYAMIGYLSEAYAAAVSDADRARIHEITDSLRGTDTRITNVLFMNDSEGAVYQGHTGLLLMNEHGQGFFFSFWHDVNDPRSSFENKPAEMRFSVLSKAEVDELKDGYGSIGGQAITNKGYRRDESYDRFVWEDVTAEQGARMFNEAAYLFAHPGEYNLVSPSPRQCDVIAQEILAAGGVRYDRAVRPNNTYFNFKGEYRRAWRNKLGEERNVKY